VPANVGAAVRAAAAALAATSDTARLDAEWLMAHALGVSRSDLLLRHMGDAVPAGFAALVARRAGHEPVAYILGHAEFYGLTLAVGPDVLIPRGDSETLIEAARLALEGRPPARILDLGTGSGCLLLAALSLWPQAEGVGVERSAGARAVAGANAQRLGLPARIIAADWTMAGWAADLGRFELILANPPYVEADAALAPDVAGHEPHSALFSGPEGLDDYRLLIPQLPALLAPQGLALIEIGWQQAAAVAAIAHAAGLATRLHHDLAGRPRTIAAWASGAPWEEGAAQA